MYLPKANRQSSYMLSCRATVTGSLLLLAAAGCGEKETPEYRLSAEQLAWQPYHVGDVLRFGQAHTSKVRTFVIEAVSDKVETLCNSCGGGINLFPSGSSRLQKIRVDVRRTDTVRYIRSASSTPARPDSVALTGGYALLELGMDNNHGSGPVRANAQVYWDFRFDNYLPIQEVVAGQALPDTAAHLLPSLQVGGIRYGPVLQVSNSAYYTPPLPRTKSIRRLYYAKGVGVVAFVEGGTLWYKLQ